MAPAANNANTKPSTNLLKDIFSSLLWVLLTDDADRNLPTDYVGHRCLGQALALRRRADRSMLKSAPMK